MSRLRVGVAGPVGSGKTALVEALCLSLRHQLQLAVVTNDIYTQEDAQFLTRAGALEPERIRGVETGGCPHTAIREDCSINRAAVEELEQAFPGLDLVLVESGGEKIGLQCKYFQKDVNEGRESRCERQEAEDDPKGDAHGGPGRKVSCCLSQGGAGRETDANTEGQKGARGLAHRPTPVR